MIVPRKRAQELQVKLPSSSRKISASKYAALRILMLLPSGVDSIEIRNVRLKFVNETKTFLDYFVSAHCREHGT